MDVRLVPISCGKDQLPKQFRCLTQQCNRFHTCADRPGHTRQIDPLVRSAGQQHDSCLRLKRLQRSNRRLRSRRLRVVVEPSSVSLAKKLQPMREALRVPHGGQGWRQGPPRQRVRPAQPPRCSSGCAAREAPANRRATNERRRCRCSTRSSRDPIRAIGLWAASQTSAAVLSSANVQRSRSSAFSTAT